MSLVGAIGSGRQATAEDIDKAHRFIYECVCNVVQGCTPQILYGGSVNAATAAELFSIEYVHGLLVGGASLLAKEFSEICCLAS